MRVDKYLWCIRVFKTRSVSTTACRAGKVSMKDVKVKPSNSVKCGDVIDIRKGAVLFSWEVLEIPKNRVGPKLVPDFTVERTTAEELERFKLIQLANKQTDRNRLGRPTKKNRRDLDDFLD
ncbi:MAG: ribosome-associated heat shock protein Hsp15 [Litorivivens sp.]|jgi:ribosome-associated heat shock protein Hsp15